MDLIYRKYFFKGKYKKLTEKKMNERKNIRDKTRLKNCFYAYVNNT